MRILLAVSASLALAGATRAESAPGGPEAPTAAEGSVPADASPQAGTALPAARLPGFAAALANERPITDASGWTGLPYAQAWREIARSTPATRQSARWRYARSLIGQDRPAEAYGVLVAMAQDDPDLALVPAYRLARGAAETRLGRHADALATLSADLLADNPEACAWRLLAMAAAEMNEDALGQWPCARPAIASRKGSPRGAFLLAVARSAIATERAGDALTLLGGMPDADPAANVLRGRAMFRLGQAQDGRLRLERAMDNGNPEQRVEAELSLVEGLVAEGRADPRQAYDRLERLAYCWRGGPLERRTLTLGYQLAETLHDDPAAMRSGAALLRYHAANRDTAALLASLQQRLGAILAPGSTVNLPDAAGLFWDYRDLVPSGAGGDLMVSQLAGRLQAARLYDRAAELLDYQLLARMKDISQGPLSVRVGELYILAGRPEDALKALRATDGNIYPNDMLWARLRIEAIALHQLGRTDEALAVLDGVPGGQALRNEIEWARRNWKALADADGRDLPRAGRLSEVQQAVVLRRAVAFAMLGRESALADLRRRYGAAFAGLPTGAAFDLLTGPVEELDSSAVAQAMAAIPTASPVGEIADLLAAGQEAT